MEIQKLSSNVFTAKCNFYLGDSGTRIKRHVYIGLLKAEKNILIDTGASNNIEDIKELTGYAGTSIEDIDLIINTHCHPDHIGANYTLKELNPSIKILAHPLAAQFIEDIDKQYKIRPVPGFYRLISGKSSIDMLLNDGDEIDAGFKIKIIHTPGHSPGSISIFLTDQKVIFTGDAVPGINDVPIYENVEEMHRSFEKLGTTRAKIAISSFDGPSGSIHDLISAGVKYLNHIEELIKDYISENDQNFIINNANIKHITSFVLRRLGFNDLKPIGIINKSIESHLKSLLFKD